MQTDFKPPGINAHCIHAQASAEVVIIVWEGINFKK
jgi:hypothetical protein